MNIYEHPDLRVYDNGGETMDRYTVLRLDWPARMGFVEAYAMSDDPRGFAQHCTAQDGPHLGKRISWGSLPVQCRNAASHFNQVEP